MFQIKVLEELKTHILGSVTFFFPENHAVYEIMWKNIVERGRAQMTVWRIRIACWITKATNTHSEYVTLIALNSNNGYTNASQRYVLRTLPVFLCLSFSILTHSLPAI